MKKEFYFCGSNVGCGNDEPHIPHVKSYYDTVCWGSLENFCTGRSGILSDGRELTIRVIESTDGNAAVPGHVKGYYEIK